MSTYSAFLRGLANSGREPMVFDWDRAAQIIKDSGATYAEAGLSGDWEYTGGIILEDGKPTSEDYTYLASTWATPQLRYGVEDGVTTVSCFKMQSETDWDSGTKWPASALEILGFVDVPAMSRDELINTLSNRADNG